MTSRRRYLSTLALVLAGCSTQTETPDDGPADGSPTDTDDPAGGDPTPTDGTPTPTVEALSIDHPAVPWAVQLPRPVAQAPAVHPESGRVFVPLGRNAIGTPSGSGGPADGAMVALSGSDGAVDWRTRLDAPVAGDLSLHDGRLHVVTGYSTGFDGHDQRVRAFGLDGAEAWASDPRSAWLSVVASHAGTTFVATGDDAVAAEGETLFALGADGSVSWEQEVGDAGGAAVVDGKLLYGNGGQELGAYGLDGGEELWTVAGEALGNPESGVVVADGLCFTQAAESSAAGYPLVAHAVADGSERWTYSFEQDGSNFLPGGVASLTGHDGSAAVVGTDSDGSAFALEADGTEAWRVDVGGRLAYGGPLVGDAVYVATRGGAVVALDPANGDERWRKSFGGAVTVRAADSGLFAYSGRNRGRLVAALGADGTERWRYELESGVNDATVVGDRLYAVVSGRSLYVFDHGG